MADEPTQVTPEGSGGAGTGLDERQRRQLFRIGVLVVIGILLITFIFRNTREVKVSFVFFTATSSLIWVIVSSLVLGLVAGLLLPGLLRRAKAKRQAAKGA